VTKKNAVFCDVTPCEFIINRRCGGTCRLNLHLLFLSRVISFTLKMQATRSSETSVCNEPTWRHIPEYVIIQFLSLIFSAQIIKYSLLFVSGCGRFFSHRVSKHPTPQPNHHSLNLTLFPSMSVDAIMSRFTQAECLRLQLTRFPQTPHPELVHAEPAW
jgi:hypothetical protein